MATYCSVLAWVSSGRGLSRGQTFHSKVSYNTSTCGNCSVGRFGNQMSQYIGAIAFAKGLDRTLVLPPFVRYRPMTAGSVS